MAAPGSMAVPGSIAPPGSMGVPAAPDPGGQETNPAPGIPARPDRPDHLRVVRRDELTPRQRRRRTRFAMIATGLFVVAVLFGLVGLHVMLAQNQFRLDRLNGQGDAEQARYERLRLQVDQLESPQRIVATAEQKLGMVTPSSVTYLTPSAPLATASSSSTTGSDPVAGQGSVATPVTFPAAATPPDWAIVKPHLAAQP